MMGHQSPVKNQHMVAMQEKQLVQTHSGSEETLMEEWDSRTQMVLLQAPQKECTHQGKSSTFHVKKPLQKPLALTPLSQSTHLGGHLTSQLLSLNGLLIALWDHHNMLCLNSTRTWSSCLNIVPVPGGTSNISTSTHLYLTLIQQY